MAENFPAPTEAQMLGVLNKVTGRNFRVLPRGWIKTARIFSLSEIEFALQRLAEDDWHGERIGELSSDYLLRATTIDKFLSMVPKKNERTAF